MKTVHSPMRTLVGLSMLAGFGMFGSSSAEAQQTYCPSGTCPTTYTTYAPAVTYTYSRQAPATVQYQYQYQSPAAVQYRYQYQAPAAAQYRYQYQTPAAVQYQTQAAAAPVQYQQAASTVQYSSYYHAAGATTTPTYQAAAAPATTGGGDSYGFLSWLNSTRASYGLSAVGYDANLESWASVNNGHQQSRGLGHYVMGSARRQNSAMGSYSQIGSMWMNSAAHRAALLDPSIRSIGIAGSGSYWTFNAN